MSIAAEKTKKEAKELLCHLLRIPVEGSQEAELFIDKILFCATIEAMALIKQDKKGRIFHNEADER